MNRHMTSLAAFGAVASLCVSMAVSASAADAVKIGVLNDMSGVYADLAGPGSVEAAKMAIEDFGGNVLGQNVELVFADHQNKADVGAGIARRWFDEGVDVAVDFSNSSVGFAVQSLAKDKNKLALITAASSDFTGKACTSTSAQWVYTSRTNGYGLAQVLSGEGLDSWYLVTVDYAFGHAFANEMRKAVEQAGGKVLGESRYPLGTADMSSFLLNAQATTPKVVAFSAAGTDVATAVKQAKEYGIDQTSTIATPSVFLSDVHAMGLETAQGLKFITAFYWDYDDKTREFAERFFKRRGSMPGMTHAGVYSAVLHYLKAVEAAGSKDAGKVMSKMRELPVEDMFSRNGKLREDGQMVHDMYLVEVKKPSESTKAWDYLKVIKTVPGDEIFQSLAESTCPLLKK